MITIKGDSPVSVYAADLDGDRDLDVLSASFRGQTLPWYENTDGAGHFGQQQVIMPSVGAEGFMSVYAADLDGDGDVDVLSASIYDDRIAWYENTDGQGHFADQQMLTTVADGASSVYAEDLDGDGDLDVLSASSYKASLGSSTRCPRFGFASQRWFAQGVSAAIAQDSGRGVVLPQRNAGSRKSAAVVPARVQRSSSTS